MNIGSRSPHHGPTIEYKKPPKTKCFQGLWYLVAGTDLNP
jgi:hypothetical protein